MFIRKSDYQKLWTRISYLDTCISNIERTQLESRADFDEKLCAFAESVGEIQDKISGVLETTEASEKERQREKEFFDGLTNILTYGAPYDKKQDN